MTDFDREQMKQLARDLTDAFHAAEEERMLKHMVDLPQIPQDERQTRRWHHTRPARRLKLLSSPYLANAMNAVALALLSLILWRVW
jgi:hypothetical protein